MIRFAASLATVALVLAACGETLSSAPDDPGLDGGAESGAESAAPDGSNAEDAPVLADAGCDGLAADFDFEKPPFGVSTSVPDGSSLNTLDGSLVVTSTDGFYVTMKKRFLFAPSSVSLAYTIHSLSTDLYTELGCYISLIDAEVDPQKTTLITWANEMLVGFDDSVVYADGGSAPSGASLVLYSQKVSPGPHRLVIEMPSVQVGSVQVKVRLDDQETSFQTSLLALPIGIDLSCGIELQHGTGPKELTIDDVALRACPR